MRICIDIDDTITYAPDFFALLVDAVAAAEVIIVSFRSDRDAAVELLRACGIRWDRLILSNDTELGVAADQSLIEWKAHIVNELSPDWFFEDMPEVNCRINSKIRVFMPCDDVIRNWLGDQTGATRKE